MFVTLLSTDGIRVRLAVGETVRTGFTVFTEPEPDRICGCLSSFIFREAVRCVARIAIHEDRLQTCERVCTEYGRRCCGRVGVAVRIAVRVLDTVTDFTGRLDPVFGSIQIFPLSTGVVFQVVKSGVRLGFDFDGSFRVTGIRGCCLRRNERKQRNEAQRKCQEFQESSLHISSFLWL